MFEWKERGETNSKTQWCHIDIHGMCLSWIFSSIFISTLRAFSLCESLRIERSNSEISRVKFYAPGRLAFLSLCLSPPSSINGLQVTCFLTNTLNETMFCVFIRFNPVVNDWFLLSLTNRFSLSQFSHLVKSIYGSNLCMVLPTREGWAENSRTMRNPSGRFEMLRGGGGGKDPVLRESSPSFFFFLCFILFRNVSR